jgi:hypothetical protein
MKLRWEDLAAMILVGDGVLSLLHPRRHSAIWKCGPASYQKFAGELEKHPPAARGMGLVFVALGLWLGHRAASQFRS